jgi:hypothetical protein
VIGSGALGMLPFSELSSEVTYRGLRIGHVTYDVKLYYFYLIMLKLAVECAF